MLEDRKSLKNGEEYGKLHPHWNPWHEWSIQVMRSLSPARSPPSPIYKDEGTFKLSSKGHHFNFLLHGKDEMGGLLWDIEDVDIHVLMV